ncbi:50S ribosomal protein L10 [archaeon]|jgi:large subunit ribosomal protein L10|nr:50S ribosomal protein L10 [archaeon]MBT4242158.1 50S ribosomal protein L10 [archaeon]MBT4417846.1 50S ribosomal protein L10 [archaeon]
MAEKTNNPIENFEKTEDSKFSKTDFDAISSRNSNPSKSPIKAKQVTELVNKIQSSKTLMIVSIKGVPSKQFQDIKKAIRDSADVKVAKKNIMLRTLEGLGKESAKELESHIKENCAFVLSNIDGFELAGLMNKKKTPVFAKAGQIAPDDIEVQDGPTDLVPGPAISELGALGIQIAVEDGKIAIKAPKVVVTEGGVISGEVASLLQKLNIQPMTIGLEPVAVYDVETEKIYTNIKINPEEVAMELASAAGKSLGFAQKIAYYCKETIGYLLAKANMEGEGLSKLQPVEEVKEESVEDSKDAEEVKEESAEDSSNASEEVKEEKEIISDSNESKDSENDSEEVKEEEKNE